ncbi:hypothetical protein BC830DRAFT_1086629 [Chytriomyces sp. MP71]|nr:hypothetical protein BC830DRAFT_1086629 [Chytriomyces sp. MP71]
MGSKRRSVLSTADTLVACAGEGPEARSPEANKKTQPAPASTRVQLSRRSSTPCIRKTIHAQNTSADHEKVAADASEQILPRRPELGKPATRIEYLPPPRQSIAFFSRPTKYSSRSTHPLHYPNTHPIACVSGKDGGVMVHRLVSHSTIPVHASYFVFWVNWLFPCDEVFISNDIVFSKVKFEEEQRERINVQLYVILSYIF